jgi:hypothetical protein
MLTEARGEGAPAQLLAVSDGLSVYLAGSEQVFLETHLRLHNVQERAGRLVTESASTAAVAAQKDTDLGEGLKALDRDLAQSGRVLHAGAACLVRIIACVDQLVPFAGHFEGIGATLWSLALAIRIEDAKGCADGGRFETVVCDVRRLGGSIAPSFAVVLSQALALRAAAAEALEGAEGLLCKQAEQLAEQLQVTRGELALLEARRAPTRALGRKVATASTQLDGSLSAIFRALQMHDVARQIIEQVRGDLALAGEGQAPREGEVEQADLAALCEVQAEQLERAREILTTALTDLAIGLGRVSDAARDVAVQSLSLAKLRDTSAASARANGGLRRAGAALDEQVTSEHEALVAIQRVISRVREIRGLTRPIDRIGADVKFIALNAMVQAEKGRETGRSLAVLARAVREVSIDVQRRTLDVRRVMASVSGEGFERAGDEPQAAPGDGLTARMRALLGSMEGDREDVCVGIDVLSNEGLALRDEVNDLSRKLAINAQEVTAIKALERVLGAMAAEAGASAGPAACDAARARLASSNPGSRLAHLHVIHRALTTSVAEPPPADVGGTCELF